MSLNGSGLPPCDSLSRVRSLPPGVAPGRHRRARITRLAGTRIRVPPVPRLLQRSRAGGGEGLLAAREVLDRHDAPVAEPEHVVDLVPAGEVRAEDGRALASDQLDRLDVPRVVPRLPEVRDDVAGARAQELLVRAAPDHVRSERGSGPVDVAAPDRVQPLEQTLDALPLHRGSIVARLR